MFITIHASPTLVVLPALIEGVDGRFKRFTEIGSKQRVEIDITVGELCLHIVVDIVDGDLDGDGWLFFEDFLDLLFVDFGGVFRHIIC